MMEVLLSCSKLVLSVDGMLKFLGPVLTLLVLAFGFLQIYPGVLHSVIGRGTYGAELERRVLERAVRMLKWVITLLALSATAIVVYPAIDILQREWSAWPHWSDEVAVGLSLATLFFAICVFALGAWFVGVEMMIRDGDKTS